MARRIWEELLKTRWWVLAIALLAAPVAASGPRVKLAGGNLEGIPLASADAPVNAYLGIAYAAPPVGPLRWRPPQPTSGWKGTRKADHFGARCMQQPLFADMKFRSTGASEDCLTLNIWVPADMPKGAHLPVLFYIHGGGAIAGDGSELRYDGASMARRGIVVVTINYRLGLFGFFATRELAEESRDHAAGNYGLLDQAAALGWVRRNIAAFGGDPARITIGGESAGSMSVSLLMVSPMTRALFAGAIGESGAVLPPTFHPKSLAQAEHDDAALAQAIGAPRLADLRAMPAEKLLEAQGRQKRDADIIVDGLFLTERPFDTFAAGQDAHVPLLLGSNSQENGWTSILGDLPPTVANYRAGLSRIYGEKATALFALYPAASDADVPAAATALASDRFLAASTWGWAEFHRRTGQPTYYYYYAHVRPPALPPLTNPSRAPIGAVHSAEIEYALGNVDTNPAYAWGSADRTVSATMQGYFAAFIKTGNPNAERLAYWNAEPVSGDAILRQRIDVETRAEPLAEQARYRAALPLLDSGG